MTVTVDNIWATPSGLHMRVTVWGPENRWRHRYDAMVPVEEIHAEAVSALFDIVADDKWAEDLSDIPLF